MDAIRAATARAVRAVIFGVGALMFILATMPLLPHWLIAGVVVGAIAWRQRERILDMLARAVRRYDEWRDDRATLAGDVTPTPACRCYTTDSGDVDTDDDTD